MSEEEKAILKENNVLLKEIHGMLSKLTNPSYQQDDLMKALCVNLAANLLIRK